MNDDIVLRDSVPGDVETIAAIAVAAWEPILAGFRQAMGEELFAAACRDWEHEKARQVRAACEAAGAPGAKAAGPGGAQAGNAVGVAVAQAGGRVVGFITFYTYASGVGEIGNNAVHPDFQGRGIGPRMYQHVFDRMRAKGMRFVKVRTGGDPAHAPARRAYEKAGFAIKLPTVEYYRKL